MSWCKDCQAAVEWHLTKEGRRIPLDPLPRPDGDFMFDAALRVVRAPLDLRRAVREANARGEVHAKKLYVVHWDHCPKRREPVKREPLECFRCGSTEHFVAECPEDDDGERGHG